MSTSTNGSGPGQMPNIRPSTLLRVPKLWIMPAVLAGVLIALISLIYVGSVVNPTGHLHDLPVLVVNQDKGVNVAGKQLAVGAKVVSGLQGAAPVTSRLALRETSLADAKHQMDNDHAFATIVIPANFSASLTDVYGLTKGDAAAGLPVITILTNQRSGSLATSLATGVTQPALAKISPTIAAQFSAAAGAAPDSSALAALRANPISTTTQVYRPLPSHSALGLSAFYIALLALMSGFLGGTITNSSIDSAVGYAPTEVGPKWRLRRPLPVTRWHTLQTKWVVAAVIAPVLDGIMLLIAVGVLHVYAPNVLYLWLFTAFGAMVVAIGTLVLFATFGALGQLVAMLVFLYLSLASSGGTVPIQALPGPFRWAANFEPLRQILGGVRSIMYFDMSGEAGLSRGLLMTAIGLVFWLIVGFAVTRFYDRRGLARISPEALAYVNRSLAQLQVEKDEALTSEAVNGNAEAHPAGVPAESAARLD